MRRRFVHWRLRKAREELYRSQMLGRSSRARQRVDRWERRWIALFVS